MAPYPLHIIRFYNSYAWLGFHRSVRCTSVGFSFIESDSQNIAEEITESDGMCSHVTGCIECHMKRLVMESIGKCHLSRDYHLLFCCCSLGIIESILSRAKDVSIFHYNAHLYVLSKVQLFDSCRTSRRRHFRNS